MRANAYLKRQYRAILSYIGMILSLAGITMFFPLFALIDRPGEFVHISGFILPATLLSGAGLIIWKRLPVPAAAMLTVPDGGVIVLLSWMITCLFSAWPFMAVEGMNFTQAVFESVSGWTTTGLSVADLTRATHLTLLWRSIMQLGGGAGLAIIMLAALTGPAGSGISAAEGRSELLVPHVRRSAKLVVNIYVGYAIAGFFAYWLAGMNCFDAVNHSFAAVSTGGFSTYPESIGHWNSPAIEAISLPLMILGNLNFVTAYLLFRGKFKRVIHSGEVMLFGVLTAIAALILWIFICRELYTGLGKSIRVAIFETVTALTTTGFSTTVYHDWATPGILILLLLMLIGGGTCSTAGGLKQYRVYLLFRTLLWELRRPFRPRTSVEENYIWQGERKDFIDDKQIRRISLFAFIYLTVYMAGAFVLALHGYGLRESLFEFASALGTVGLSVGVTTADAPASVLWALIAGMLLGRLEFFVVIISAVKLFRDLPAITARPAESIASGSAE